MARPVELTTGDFRRVAASVAEVFAESKLRIETGSDLAQMLAELEWVGQFKGVFTDAVAADRNRALRAVLLYEQMTHIEDAVARVRRLRNCRAKLQHLRRNQLNSLSVPSGHGLQTLFEIQIASRLVQPFWSVSFDEPDIVLANPAFGRIGVACKRPRTVRGLGRSMLDASVQITRSGFPGYVVLSVEGCSKTYLGTSETQEELACTADKLLNETLDRILPSVAKGFEPPTCGVIACGRFIAVVKKPSSWCWAFRTAKLPNRELDGAVDGLEAINAVLVGNQGPVSRDW